MTPSKKTRSKNDEVFTCEKHFTGEDIDECKYERTFFFLVKTCLHARINESLIRWYKQQPLSLFMNWNKDMLMDGTFHLNTLFIEIYKGMLIMFGSKEGSSSTLPSPPQSSPPHEFQLSRHSREYLWTLTSCPTLSKLSDKGQHSFPL